VRGAACARWKKFHLLEGFEGSFSGLTFFELLSHLPSLPSTSLVEFFRLRTGAILGALDSSENLTACDVRLDASAGRNDLFESSSLSDGLRRPKGIFLNGEPPRTVSGIAEGSKIGLLSVEGGAAVLLTCFIKA
jgi:hypothetical protein